MASALTQDIIFPRQEADTMRLHTRSKEKLPTQSTLCQVIEQGRWRDLLCEKIGLLPDLLERAAALSAGCAVSFADALEKAIQETGGTARSIFADESEALAHDLGLRRRGRSAGSH